MTGSATISPDLIAVLPGILLLIGGILAIIPKRGTAIAGGVLLLVGVGLVVFFVFLGGYFQAPAALNDEIQAIEVFAPGVHSMALFGSTTYDYLLVSWTLSWQVGWGTVILLVCGIFALAGSGKSK
jgi:hypothetical protein